MKRNSDNSRKGFLDYCKTIAGIEKDKDVFCNAARIPRNGCDVFRNLDGIILDLNKKCARNDLYSSDYAAALDKLRAIIDAQNAHELKMAEIAAGIDKQEDEGD